MTKGIPEILGGMVDSLFLLAPRIIAACRPPRAAAQSGFESALDHLFQEGYVAHPERFFSFPAGVPVHRVVDEAPYEDGAYELISFKSDYAPRIPMLREAYLSHAANGTGYIARWTHRKPAPRTVLCLHGYLLGDPAQAHRMFRVRRLFDMGLDVALFITPFHWRRAPASVFRRGIFLSPHDPAMTCECVGHAMHDLAGALAILNELGSTGTGLIGASLGGYLAALYACLRDDVDFSAMMVPAVNLSRPLGTDRARFTFPVSAGLRERMRQVYEIALALALFTAPVQGQDPRHRLPGRPALPLRIHAPPVRTLGVARARLPPGRSTGSCSTLGSGAGHGTHSLQRRAISDLNRISSAPALTPPSPVLLYQVGHT